MRLSARELRRIISEEVSRLSEVYDGVGERLFSAERMLRDLMEEDESPDGWKKWAGLWDSLVPRFKKGVLSLEQIEEISARFGFSPGDIDVELMFNVMSKVPTLEWRSAQSGRDIFFTEDIEDLPRSKSSNVVQLFK